MAMVTLRSHGFPGSERQGEGKARSADSDYCSCSYSYSLYYFWYSYSLATTTNIANTIAIDYIELAISTPIPPTIATTTAIAIHY